MEGHVSHFAASLRILVVEDEVAVSRLIGRILKPPRFEVVSAISADAARKYLVPPPSLILLDMGLEGESSEDFCHSVHRDPLTQEVPILILTGRGMPDLDETSVATCAQDLVQKPFDAAELVFHVEALLKKAAYELRHSTIASSIK